MLREGRWVHGRGVEGALQPEDVGLVQNAAVFRVPTSDRSSDDSEGTFDLGDSCGIRGACSSRCSRSCGRPYDSEVSDGDSTGRLVGFH